LKNLCGDFEITIKSAVFLLQNWIYGGRDKVAHFLGYGGIKEVSLCPLYINTAFQSVAYQKKPIPAYGILRLSRGTLTSS
jgi:hypothetical protein